MKVSIVIPVFNEAERLPPKLLLFVQELKNLRLDYELVFVNDGSTDLTGQWLDEYAAKNTRARVIHSAVNRGRGYGMKTGALASSGDYVLETDADLPVPPSFLVEFIDFLEQNQDCGFVIGSRNHRDSRFILNQPPLRVMAGYVFHFLFRIFFGISSWDVMCGFKVFRKTVAHDIFRFVYDDRYLAAGELVFVAKKFNYKFKELPVAWQDDRRSKVKVVSDSLATVKGMAEMYMRNLKGYYEKKQ